jgi:hypothetical protein
MAGAVVEDAFDIALLVAAAVERACEVVQFRT